MFQHVITLVLCLLAPVMATQFTLIDASNTSRSFDLSTLEITFSNGTLITNQGYSAHVTTFREGNFDAVVSTRKNPGTSLNEVRSIRFASDAHILFKAPSTGHGTIEMFNAMGQRIHLIYDGQMEKGIEKSFRVPTAPGKFYIHFKSEERSETYVMSRI